MINKASPSAAKGLGVNFVVIMFAVVGIVLKATVVFLDVLILIYVIADLL